MTPGSLDRVRQDLTALNDNMWRLMCAERDITAMLAHRSRFISSDILDKAQHYRALSMIVFGDVRADRTEEAIQFALEKSHG